MTTGDTTVFDAAEPVEEVGAANRPIPSDRPGPSERAGDNDTSRATLEGTSVIEVAAEEQIFAALQNLTDGMDRIAAAVVPLLSQEYDATLQRMRVLERKILHRQERPIVNRVARLLEEVQRLDGETGRLHCAEGLLDLLHGLGYEQFGSAGDAFDREAHEVIAATEGHGNVVARVHAAGIRAGSDVLIKAKVTLGNFEVEGDEPDGNGA
ncbi:MAG: hypothetical protein KDB86_01015 [Actinobacteria bacterium]|nr:hypothetical protein [Actinomycetota bacterium]